MDLKAIIKGGQLAGKRKAVLGIIGILAAIGAYLTGDSDLISALTQVAPVLVCQ